MSLVDESTIDTVQEAIEHALGLGAEFADARLFRVQRVSVLYDNDRLRENQYSVIQGAGFRIIYKGVHAYSSTTTLDPDSLRRAVESALKLAKALEMGGAEPRPLAEAPILRARAESPWLRDPFSVEPERMIEVARLAVESARSVPGVSSAVAGVAAERVERAVVNSEGTLVQVGTIATGLLVSAYARGPEGLERVYDSWGRVAGWEHIEGLDPEEAGREIGKLAVDAARARPPEAGRYSVVLEPSIVGTLVHEALGHASEADLVASGESILQGRLGEQVANEEVSVVDDGRTPGGYYVPFDDEGVEKRRTLVLDRGILRALLTGRAEAAALGLPLTGNARVQDHARLLLVRQTNYFILPGDWRLEELLEETENGIYVTGKGGGGGQVDPGTGSFTFNVGVSYAIRKGELAEPLRGVNISGAILETLRNVRGLGRRLVVRTGAVFGGCGKGGQLVRVGDGGPHMLVENMQVGGR